MEKCVVDDHNKVERYFKILENKSSEAAAQRKVANEKRERKQKEAAKQKQISWMTSA